MKKKDVRHESDYWNDFYKNWTIDIPSQFCVLAATEIEKDHVVVEFGCGNGRDSLYLAEHNYKVVAMDLSQEAIKKDKLAASHKKGKSLAFLQGDVSCEDDVRAAINHARNGDNNQKITVYTRFFLHTLDAPQEDDFTDALSKYLKSNDKLYFEFRSIEDEYSDKIYEDHYRRYIETDKFINRLEIDLGFRMLYQITGQGMAKYRKEDPFVSRVIVEKE